MADYPDVYADGFSITVGPFGVTLTLSRSIPTGETGPHETPSEPVVRVRLSQALGKAIADAFVQMSAATAQTVEQSKVKH